MSLSFWKLFGRSSWGRRGRPPFEARRRRLRPGIGSLEQLEDRLVLSASPPAVTANSVIAEASSGGTETLFAISADHDLYRHVSSGWQNTGLAWIESVTAATDGSGNPVAFIETEAHDLFVLTAQGQLVQTGLEWIQSISAASDASGNPVVYIQTEANDVFTYSVSTGLHSTGLAWVQSLAAVTNASGTAQVYILTQGDDVFTYDSTDGLQFAGLQWITALSATTVAGGGPVAYVTTQKNDLFSFSPSAGLTEIASPAPLRSLSAGTNASGQAELYAISDADALLKLNAQGQWSQLQPPATPASFTAGAMDQLFIAAADSSVFVYNGSSQAWTELAQTESGGTLVGVAQTVTATDGTFSLAVDGTLWQYTSGTGTQITGPSGTALAAIALSPDGALYARTSGGQVYQYSSSGWTLAPNVGLSQDGSLVDVSSDVTATAGHQFSGSVAEFSDTDPSANPSATINWGDGTSSTGQIGAPNSDGFRQVSGVHIYASGGNYQITVTVTDEADGYAVSSTADASVTYTVTAQGTNFSATVGQNFSGNVAEFTDGDPQANLSAVINWGDGTSSTSGQISGPSASGVYEVSGSHTYASSGDYQVTITVLDRTDNQSGSGTASASVISDTYPISVSGLEFSAGVGQTFSGAVAQFTDADPQPTLSASINWGDGTASTVGTVSGSNGTYSVSGSHIYTSSGNYQVTVTVVDSTDNQSSSASGLAQVSGATVPTQSSSNWSGYAIEPGSQVDAVGGSWVIPTISSTGRSSDSAVWVGIDGWDGGTTVEQIGTNEDIVHGQASYSAWVELYGDESPQGQLGTYYYQYTLPLTVNPGDTIDASVVYEGGSSFTFTIQDIPVSGGTPSTWQSTLTMQYAVPAAASAEWIVEAPEIGNGEATLANFGTVSFAGAWATIAGRTGSINSFSNSFAVDMSDPSGGTATVSNPPLQSNTPGPYESGGSTSSTFTVTYGAFGSDAARAFGSFAADPFAMGAIVPNASAAKASDGQSSADNTALIGFLSEAETRPLSSGVSDPFRDPLDRVEQQGHGLPWFGDDLWAGHDSLSIG